MQPNEQSAKSICRDFETLKSLTGGRLGNSADLILVSGPSCSGKTVWTERLATSLNGLHVAGDDWALSEAEVIARLGRLDLECPEAYDLDSLAVAISQLFLYGTTLSPRFDFAADRITGYRQVRRSSGPVLLEFLHSFDPLLRQGFSGKVLKIYIDGDERLRFKRRLARDTRFRGRTETAVLREWQQVLEGERRFLDSYRLGADIVFVPPTDENEFNTN